MMDAKGARSAMLLHNEEGMKTMRGVGLITILCVAAAAAPLAQSGTVPVPRPFPGAPAPPPATNPSNPAPKPAPPQTPPSGTTTTQKPAPSATTAPSAAAPTSSVATPPAPSAGPALPGVPPIYPTAQFLESIDAGSGQSYHLYGADAAFADVVSYYRTVLKNGGREIYRIPAIQQFDLGRFDDGKMTYPPSVVIKDYSGGSSPGYLHISGLTEKRYRTIIQIVPPGIE